MGVCWLGNRTSWLVVGWGIWLVARRQESQVNRPGGNRPLLQRVKGNTSQNRSTCVFKKISNKYITSFVYLRRYKKYSATYMFLFIENIRENTSPHHEKLYLENTSPQEIWYVDNTAMGYLQYSILSDQLPQGYRIIWSLVQCPVTVCFRSLRSGK